jgi:hypothetical protein
MANDFVYPVTAEGNLIVLNNFKMISCAFFYFGEKCVFILYELYFSSFILGLPDRNSRDDVLPSGFESFGARDDRLHDPLH